MKVVRKVLGTESMRNMLLLVIVVIVIGGIAFRVDLSSNHSNLEQRIQVNLVLIVTFAKASDSFRVSPCTCILVLFT